MNKQDESAFPQVGKAYDRNMYATMFTQGGLTKRELFAAMVCAGALGGAEEVDRRYGRQLAKNAVMLADALLAELERSND